MFVTLLTLPKLNVTWAGGLKKPLRAVSEKRSSGIWTTKRGGVQSSGAAVGCWERMRLHRVDCHYPFLEA